MRAEPTFANSLRTAKSIPVFAERRAVAVASKTTSGYLVDIRRFAMLEPEQEYALAVRWREHGDHEAAHQLVTSHLRLAAKIARKYSGYGLPISDVISEANVGLMQAVNRFEPEMGFRLATYALWWIRASIQDYILRSWSLVRIGTTTNQRRLFFKLRAAKNRIAALESSDLRPDQVTLMATSLDVRDRDVVDMNRRLGGDYSLNAPLREDGQAGEWQDTLADEGPSPEAIVVEHDEKDHQHRALMGAICVLDKRERRIFEARHLVDKPRTLQDLSAEFNLSCERLRQIEVRAFEKVRSAVKKRIREQARRRLYHPTTPRCAQ